MSPCGVWVATRVVGMKDAMIGAIVPLRGVDCDKTRGCIIKAKRGYCPLAGCGLRPRSPGRRACNDKLLSPCGVWVATRDQGGSDHDLQAIVPLRGVGCDRRVDTPKIFAISYCPLAGCGLRPALGCNNAVAHGYCPLAGCGLRPLTTSCRASTKCYCPLAGCGLRPLQPFRPPFCENRAIVPLRGVGCDGKAAQIQSQSFVQLCQKYHR